MVAYFNQGVFIFKDKKIRPIIWNYQEIKTQEVLITKILTLVYKNNYFYKKLNALSIWLLQFRFTYFVYARNCL
jgi:hypothetical protein